MGGEITFRLVNEAELLDRLDLYIIQADEAIQRIAQYFVMTGTMEIKKNLYPGHGFKTGDLKASYQGEIIERSKCFARIKLWTPQSYAPPVEYMQGGKYAHFRPGIAVTSQKVKIYFNDQFKVFVK
jgi:hypothetical protein